MDDDACSVSLLSASLTIWCSLEALLCLCRGVVFWPTIVFSLMISGGIAITTYHQWNKSGEFFPQGLVCSISVAGMFFYIYNLSYIPSPKRKL